MPTYRKLHTKIVDSYDFAEMPNDFVRVFWMLLIVVVDSDGRAIDHPSWLRSRMFPLREDVRAEQIEEALAWLNQRGMIIRYQVAGRGYFQVMKFKEYQSGTEREAKSVLPAPPKENFTHEQVVSGSEQNQELPGPAVSVSVYESVNESVNAYESVYAVYEKEIGALTPIIADEMKLAETEYPAEWAVEAIQEAARNNARNWKYALAILKRWKAQGRTPPPRQKEPVVIDQSRLILPEGMMR